MEMSGSFFFVDVKRLSSVFSPIGNTFFRGALLKLVITATVCQWSASGYLSHCHLPDKSSRVRGACRTLELATYATVGDISKRLLFGFG